MVSCSAYKCSNSTAKKAAGTSFHMFPKDAAQRKLWINAVRRENWVPTKSSALCSIHFLPKCFENMYAIKRLKSGAVPSVFPAHPKHLHKDSWESEQIYSKLTIKTEIEDENIEAIDDNAQFEIDFQTEQKYAQYEADFKAKQLLSNSTPTIKQEKVEDMPSINCKQEPVDSSIINFSFNGEFDIECVKEEFAENTNDSIESASNQNRRSIEKFVFKREVPYLKRDADAMEGTSCSRYQD